MHPVAATFSPSTNTQPRTSAAKHLRAHLASAALATAALCMGTAQAAAPVTLLPGSDVVYNFADSPHNELDFSNFISRPTVSGDINVSVTWYAEWDAGGSSQLVALWSPSSNEPSFMQPIEPGGFSLRFTATGSPGASLTVVPTVYMLMGFFDSTQDGVLGQLPAAPVPEPAPTALLLAGLATLGFVARRRGAR